MLSLENSQPQTPELVPYIEYYYFLQSDDFTGDEHFVHYPHYRNTINVYRQADIQLNETGRLVRHEPAAPIRTVATRNIERFLKAALQGPYNLIGIGFRPLGLNYFLRQTLANVLSAKVCFLDEYWPGLSSAMEKVFTATGKAAKVQLLDQFFLAHLQQTDLGKLPAITSTILQKEGQVSLAELSDIFELHRRTILRLFQKHMGCSVEQYKRVVKFRTAFDAYHQLDEKPTLTSLAHNNNYYDQSDFIFHFKALAGGSPNKLLRRISQVGEEELYWLFDKK